MDASILEEFPKCAYAYAESSFIQNNQIAEIFQNWESGMDNIYESICPSSLQTYWDEGFSVVGAWEPRVKHYLQQSKLQIVKNEKVIPTRQILTFFMLGVYAALWGIETILIKMKFAANNKY